MQYHGKIYKLKKNKTQGKRTALLQSFWLEKKHDRTALEGRRAAVGVPGGRRQVGEP